MIHVEFVFIKLLTMVLGFIVASAAFRGYRRYGSQPLLFVALGFVLISVGVGLEGVLFDFTPLTLYQSSLIHSVFMVAGMACILYSIFGRNLSSSKGTVEIHSR